MTYPRTAEEKARQLGARIACEAFNACGSLDSKKCQELGDDFGTRIAELIRGNARERWAGYAPPRLPGQDRIDAAIARLRNGWCGQTGCENHVSGPGLVYCWEHGFAERGALQRDLDTFAGVPLSPEAETALEAGLASARRGEIRPLVSHEDAVRIGREVHEDYVAAKAEAERIGKELDELSRRKARGIVAEPSYMRCFVCGKHRDRQVRKACGHDTGNGAERRWYCSRECGDR